CAGREGTTRGRGDGHPRGKEHGARRRDRRSALKFCMVTTFFGGHSFGGDAAYVDRLTRALVSRGHEVHVFHCADAFEAVRGRHPLRPYTPPPGLHIHTLKS